MVQEGHHRNHLGSLNWLPLETPSACSGWWAWIGVLLGKLVQACPSNLNWHVHAKGVYRNDSFEYRMMCILDNMFFVQDFHGSTPCSSTTSVTPHILAKTLAHSTWAELHRPDSSEHQPIGKDKLLEPSPQQVTDTQLREKSALKVHLVTMVPFLLVHDGRRDGCYKTSNAVQCLFGFRGHSSTPTHVSHLPWDRAAGFPPRLHKENKFANCLPRLLTKAV